MTGQDTQFGWCRAGLRTRYRPRVRICRGLIEAAPWLDAGLLLVFFLFVASHQVLKAGVAVELPATATLSTTRTGPTAVIISHEGSDGGEREEMVFFDDEPFAVRDQRQMNKLQRRFAQSAGSAPELPLVIEADVRVKYGTVSMLCGMGRDAGFRVVNLAQTRVEEQKGE